MAYATVEDIEARWRMLTADEQSLAQTLLDDASVMLARLVTIDESDEQQATLLKQVSCSMVIRSMVSSASIPRTMLAAAISPCTSAGYKIS